MKSLRAFLKTYKVYKTKKAVYNCVGAEIEKVGNSMAAKRYEISDEQWEQIKDMIPTAKTGRPPNDHRLMINAMMWMARSGAGWEDLPERYGSWKTAYSRFRKWRDDGTFEAIFKALNKDADMETLSIDSTTVKAHPHSAGAKKGL